MNPLHAILIPFVAALSVPVLFGLAKDRAKLMLAAAPFAVFLLTVQEYRSELVPYIWSTKWVPSLGINLSFKIDGLSLLFVALISGIGTLILVYAAGYFKKTEDAKKFSILVLLFMSSMLGVVLSENLILLFVFWELTSLTSFLLIGFKSGSATARAAALQALLVTGIGGLVMLFGLIMLGQAGDSFEISALIADRASILADANIEIIALLILIGALTKSAQFPFHFWLPNAMEAPTPVSAYLHSATMVKAGVFLIARLTPIFAGVVVWQTVATAAGFATFLVGAILALRRSDLKQILAYSTVSSLGVMVALLGVGSELAISTAIVFLLAHALYKGALFMIAGIIDLQTGTRDYRHLSGLGGVMPVVAAAAVLAFISLIGMLPTLGFVGKEGIFTVTLARYDGTAELIVLALVMLGFAASLVAGIRAALLPFFGKRSASANGHSRTVEAPSLLIAAGSIVLAVVGLLAGIFIFWLGEHLVTSASSAVLGYSSTIKLKLWHGFNTELMLSTVTLIFGITLWQLLARFAQNSSPFLDRLEQAGPESFYQAFLKGTVNFAALQTRIIQSGYMRNYILVVVCFLSALIIYSFSGSAYNELLFSTRIKWYWYELLLATLIIIGVVLIIRSPSRLAAVAALGLIGYCVALFYLLFSAPDLAMTQFAIETLTVILFVFVLYKLPKFSNFSSGLVRFRDGIIAVAFGSLMMAVVLFISGQPITHSISSFFEANSYLLANGRNVVNVIIVDFRALDTLGEIVVLAVAALGVHALLKYKEQK